MKWIEDIRRDYQNNEYANKMIFPSKGKYKPNHIFDENKSVKWNREQVEIENNKIEDYKKEYSKESTRLQNKLRDDLTEAITYEFGFSKQRAEKIYDYAYREKHSFMNDVFYFVEELCDLFKEILETN